MNGKWLLLSAVVAGADQGAKQYVEKHVGPKEERSVLGGRGIIRRVCNRGLMLNKLQQYTKAIRAGSAAAFALLLAGQLTLQGQKGRLLEKLGLSLMTGGAASNTLDRLVRGYVVDYAAVRTPSKRLTRLTFNLGDLALAAGAALTVIGAAKP